MNAIRRELDTETCMEHDDEPDSLSFVSLLLLSLFHFRSLSRHVHGGVRQAEHPTTLDHSQRPAATDPGQEINAFVPLHHRMEPSATH